MNTSKLILEIDYREKAIIKHIEENNPNISYKITNLPIGDFVFKQDMSIFYIIERKTILDLAASITDGRFREQKKRLLDSVGICDKIVYILEGSRSQNKFGSLSKSIIDSSILNLIFKHKYKVINTNDTIDTYNTLLSIYKKIESKDTWPSLLENNHKLIKKSDSVNNNILINMLSVIPGISINIATKIKEIYTSLPELINAYNNIDNVLEREKMLSCIQLTNKRKLGIALSKKIYKSLYEHKEENKKENKEENKEENIQDSKNTICLLD
jgi:crossover junction endonuclease MUS81